MSRYFRLQFSRRHTPPIDAFDDAYFRYATALLLFRYAAIYASVYFDSSLSAAEAMLPMLAWLRFVYAPRRAVTICALPR